MTSRIANGWHASRKHEIGDACEATSRALAARPSNSTCIAAAAYAFAVLGRRFEEALQLAERAIEVRPNSTFVRNREGAVYANSGESDKAIDQIAIALRMNPLDNITSTFTFTVGAVAHFFRSPVRGEPALGKAGNDNHAASGDPPLVRRRGSRAPWPHRRRAGRD